MASAEPGYGFREVGRTPSLNVSTGIYVSWLKEMTGFANSGRHVGPDAISVA